MCMWAITTAGLWMMQCTIPNGPLWLYLQAGTSVVAHCDYLFSHLLAGSDNFLYKRFATLLQCFGVLTYYLNQLNVYLHEHRLGTTA